MYLFYNTGLGIAVKGILAKDDEWINQGKPCVLRVLNYSILQLLRFMLSACRSTATT